MIAAICVAWIAAAPAVPGGTPRAIEPEAERLLKEMSAYLAGIQTFRVRTENSLEVLLDSGGKIQFHQPATLSIQRPDKLHADREGDIVNQELFYDGKTLTLYAADSNCYAVVEAPPTIEAALDYARDGLGLYAPAGDLVYRNAYDILTEDVVSGFHVGMSVVDGVACHHLAFRGNDVDWQIWIADGDAPLPRKFVITSKWTTGAPQYSVSVKDWNLAPAFAENEFRFVPPRDAQKIDFIGPAQGSMRP